MDREKAIELFGGWVESHGIFDEKDELAGLERATPATFIFEYMQENYVRKEGKDNPMASSLALLCNDTPPAPMLTIEEGAKIARIVLFWDGDRREEHEKNLAFIVESCGPGKMQFAGFGQTKKKN